MLARAKVGQQWGLGLLDDDDDDAGGEDEA
jgi:hypothetical protein